MTTLTRNEPWREERRANMSIARQRYLEQRAAEAEAEREALYGPVVLRRVFIISCITAEARHVLGASEVTLCLVRGGKLVVEPGSYRTAVDAILAGIRFVADMQSGTFQ